MAQTPYDAWNSLREFTAARIALGRAGASLPTRELLDFQLAHARARDAVHAPFHDQTLANQLGSLGLETLHLKTQVVDRSDYLLRPDRGRLLNDASFKLLLNASRPPDGFDLVVVLTDGLSAPAVENHAPALLQQLIPRFQNEGWQIAPLSIVQFGRVALADTIGQLLGAKLALVLLGERPGLGAADSLGAYFVYDPHPGRTDAERNCVSNIRPDGLPISQGAETLHYLMTAARTKRLSGVGLKDNRGLAELNEQIISKIGM